MVQFCGDEPVCGPWVSTDTLISHHTQPQCGPLGTYSDMVVLDAPGLNTILYHLQVGNLQIVLGRYTFVEPDCKATNYILIY